MRAPWLFALAISASLIACRRETPTQADPTSTSSAKPAESTAVPTGAQAVASTSPIAPASSVVAALPSAQSSSAAHPPAPIAAADIERAKQYVDGISRGRKTTVAKDYAAAVRHFDRALAAEPGDARALSERGYAQLLGGDLDAAAKDLEAAAKRATSAELLRRCSQTRCS